MAKTVLFLALLLLSLPPLSLSSPHPHHRHRHQQQPQELQLSDVVSALLATTNFQAWASLLLAAAPTLPNNVTATIFVPSDAAISHLPTRFDPFLLPYHILPNLRLTSARLRKLPPLSRLPTLLPNYFLLLTDASSSNLSVDHSPVTRPDLFVSRSFAVHGIRNVLFYSLYRDTNASAGAFHAPMGRPEEAREVGGSPREVEVESVWVSGDAAGCGVDEVLIGFLLVFVFGVITVKQ